MKGLVSTIYVRPQTCYGPMVRGSPWGKIDGEVLGAPAYHPRALLSVWLYGFMTGVQLVPEAGGGLPGPDTVPVADRVAASRPQYPVEVLQRVSAGHAEAVRAYRAYGGGHEVGGPGGSGGGWYEGGRQRVSEQELRCRGAERAIGSGPGAGDNLLDLAQNEAPEEAARYLPVCLRS